MPTCGSCKQQGQTIEHIRSCYEQKRTLLATVEVTGLAKQYVEQKDFRPMALVNEVPASRYAVEADGEIKFYEVRIGKPGTKWDGYRFVDHLVGAPGDWQRYPVKGQPRKELLATIAQDAKAHAVAFSKHFTICAACGSPLSDAESMARGLGPVCAEKF